MNFVKLNFDGSVNSTSCAIYGFIIRNAYGLPIYAAAKKLGSS